MAASTFGLAIQPDKLREDKSEFLAAASNQWLKPSIVKRNVDGKCITEDAYGQSAVLEVKNGALFFLLHCNTSIENGASYNDFLGLAPETEDLCSLPTPDLTVMCKNFPFQRKFEDNGDCIVSMHQFRMTDEFQVIFRKGVLISATCSGLPVMLGGRSHTWALKVLEEAEHIVPSILATFPQLAAAGYRHPICQAIMMAPSMAFSEICHH